MVREISCAQADWAECSQAAPRTNEIADPYGEIDGQFIVILALPFERSRAPVILYDFAAFVCKFNMFLEGHMFLFLIIYLVYCSMSQ